MLKVKSQTLNYGATSGNSNKEEAIAVNSVTRSVRLLAFQVVNYRNYVLLSNAINLVSTEGKESKVRVILDSGSQVHLNTENAARKLGVQ